MFHTRTVEDYGIPLTSQKIVPGDTITSVDAGGFQYTERTLAYTLGGTVAVVVGDQIVGASSGAMATVVAVGTITGTWAGNTAAGNLTIKNQIGTFTTAEIMKVAADATVATITANSTAVATDYRFKNKLAKVAVVQAVAQSALVCFDSSKPDQTLLKGWTLHAGESIVVLEEAIQRIKVVDRVSAAASTVFIQYYF